MEQRRPFTLSLSTRVSPLLAVGLLIALAGLWAAASPPPARAAGPITVTNTNASGTGSLRWAIEQANAAAGADTVVFAPAVSGAIVLTGTLPDITGTLTVSGPGSAVLSISGAAKYRVFTVGSGAALTLTSVTIGSGKSSAGGAIYSAGTLAISDTVFSGSASTGTAPGGNGGAVFIADGVTSIAEGQLSGNSAQEEGGAVFLDYGTLTVSDTQILSNTSHHAGGGICVNHGRMTAVAGRFSGNSAPLGGAVCTTGDITVTGTVFADNTATNLGGALFVQNAGATLTGVQITGNTTQNDGGGVYVAAGTLTMTGGSISDNTANRNGGGLYLDYGTADLAEVDLTGNRAQGASPNGAGGGVYVASHGRVTLSETRIIGNGARATGGALFRLGESTTLSVTDSCIVVNSSVAAVNNVVTGTVSATNNWWGAADGPSGVHAGHGDSVGTGVDFQPFLTAPILNCPSKQFIYVPIVPKHFGF